MIYEVVVQICNSYNLRKFVFSLFSLLWLNNLKDEIRNKSALEKELKKVPSKIQTYFTNVFRYSCYY